MNALHKKTVSDLRKLAGHGPKQSGVDSYLLSGHAYYGITVPMRRQLAKQWLKDNEGISTHGAIAFFDSLISGVSYEEKSFPSTILGYSASLRKAISFKRLDAWLDHLVGWAEIDGLCANTFSAKEVLERWNDWEVFIRKLSRSKNINKRRASLVFLTKPLNGSDDDFVLGLSSEIIESLKTEKPIVITKAVSWLLRSGVRYHKKEIAAYIEANMNSLPKIAIRETVRKIKTGKK